MRILLPLLTFILLNNLTGFNFWSSLAVSVWIAYLVHFLSRLNDSIAFREYILMMYGLNYLFSPALTYEVTQNIAVYQMRLNPETYFSIAIPAMLFMHIGLFSLKTKIFNYTFYTDRFQTLLNENLLKQWLIVGFFIGYTRPFLPGDLGFVAYLLGGIKYVAAFALFIIDRQKYKWYLYALIFTEVVGSLAAGMFHDMVVWVLFFSMVWTYIKKPGPSTKFVLGTLAIFLLFLLQSVKGAYREQLRTGSDGGFGSFSAAVAQNSNGSDGGLFNMKNVALSLTRANQGWIFSSAMQTMDRRQNFQGLKLAKLYAEAAFLPRALAPNKLEAGDTKIFNEYSGVRILKGTSMALGLFADGYISYGYYGTLLFAFFFGLLCALIFKLIERWAKISPYFALMAFPLLNYAVRADCETQTWMGHIVKGVIVFSIVMYYTKKYFDKKTLAGPTAGNKEGELAVQPQLVPNPV